MAGGFLLREPVHPHASTGTYRSDTLPDPPLPALYYRLLSQKLSNGDSKAASLAGLLGSTTNIQHAREADGLARNLNLSHQQNKHFFTI
ncbi:hypothetical protein PHLCEN_2v7611 [Hermanssonia centrifuga]|uniref:Uncharacterized protein n=1 Tax=Hermanssonia centrifuga TaxID=98765 RepID=A0A2R6NW26_9APHY|nr:hypothetical protein PHLCEN_2v7611 [Hermanssonia centrifuga]